MTTDTLSNVKTVITLFNAHHVDATTEDMIAKGLGAQYSYDYPQDYHSWNTRYGYEKNATNDFPQHNAARAELSAWLMLQGVQPNQTVLIRYDDFNHYCN